jgi:hypothetical protein
MREYLKEKVLPPPHTQVWVGRHRGNLNFDKRAAGFEVTRSDEPWEEGRARRRALLCALIFQGLALLSRTVDGDGVGPTVVDESQWAPIWPVIQSLRWPPPNILSDTDIDNGRLQLSPYVQMPNVSSLVPRSDGILI